MASVCTINGALAGWVPAAVRCVCAKTRHAPAAAETTNAQARNQRKCAQADTGKALRCVPSEIVP